MKNNPCLVCTMRDKDKNNNLCCGCEKRIGYLHQLDMELNFSLSYTGTDFYNRIRIPVETYLSGRLKNGFRPLE